jgi:uncharacterized protein
VRLWSFSSNYYKKTKLNQYILIKLKVMKCPKCSGNLKEEKFKGILIDRCDSCQGIWLDEPELDQLEDVVWSDDESKGTLETHEKKSDLKCPECFTSMVKFKYRFYDLELDTCPEIHGFWLDKGEETRVLDLIKKEKSDLKRKIDAEEDWAQAIKRLKSKSFFSKLKDLFR